MKLYPPRQAMRFHILILLAAGFLIAADIPKEDAARKDQEKLQGVWKGLTGEHNGDKLKDADVEMIRLTFKEDKLSARSPDGQVKEVATYKLDPGKKPPALDLVLKEGPDKDKTALGIYQLDGDMLKLCIAKPGKDRPAEFATKPDSDTALMVLKREKP